MLEIFSPGVTYLDPNEGGEYEGLDPEDAGSVVSYMAQRMQVPIE